MAKLKTGRHTSGLKELRKTKKRTELNSEKKKIIKLLIKKIKKAVKNKDLDSAKKLLNEAISKLDKLSKCGILHKSSASRKKSSLARLVNTLTSK